MLYVEFATFLPMRPTLVLAIPKFLKYVLGLSLVVAE